MYSRAIYQIVKEHVGQVSLDPSAFQCCASLSFHVVHRAVFTLCCQPFCFTLCAVVRLSHLEDTVRPVDAASVT
ncbi:hypothetical protein [Edwardsiella phage PVN09]|uniref:Uncharacterized protein n=1 Tax=Edwardsiella phage PVN09 TaxID=2859518 RepID=A0AAE8B2J4_9CAUD|nr:hypothetical protein [Edwardsiella phage PVN09]